MSQVAGRMLIRMPGRADDIMATFIKLRFVMWAVVGALAFVFVALYKPSVSDTAAVLLLYYFLAGRTGVMRVVFETRFRARTELTLLSFMGLLDVVIYCGSFGDRCSKPDAGEGRHLDDALHPFLDSLSFL